MIAMPSRRFRWEILAIPSVTLLLIVACGSANPASTGSALVPSNRVEANVYSGRENPTWTIGAGTLDALTRSIEALSVYSGSEPSATDAAGLGFRNVQVSDLQTSRGFAKLAIVGPAKVTLEMKDSTTIVLADPTSSALRSMLTEVGQHVTSEVLESIRQMAVKGSTP